MAPHAALGELDDDAKRVALQQLLGPSFPEGMMGRTRLVRELVGGRPQMIYYLVLTQGQPERRFPRKGQAQRELIKIKQELEAAGAAAAAAGMVGPPTMADRPEKKKNLGTTRSGRPRRFAPKMAPCRKQEEQQKTDSMAPDGSVGAAPPAAAAGRGMAAEVHAATALGSYDIKTSCSTCQQQRWFLALRAGTEHCHACTECALLWRG